MLGIAKKAGKLFAGYDLSVEKIRKGEAYLALAAKDISVKTFKNLKYEAERKKILALRLHEDINEVSRACSVKAGVLVLTDEGFAKALAQKIGDLQEEDFNL